MTFVSFGKLFYLTKNNEYTKTVLITRNLSGVNKCQLLFTPCYSIGVS